MNMEKMKRTGAVLAALCLMIGANGCETGGPGVNVQIDGVNGPFVTYQNGTLSMSTVLTQVSFDGGITMPLPNMPHSTIEVSPDLQSTGTLISVTLSADDLEFISKNVQLLQPNTLPGGRPLPSVLGGTMPSMAVTIPALLDATFYAGPTVFGVFIPVQLNIAGAIGTFRFYDSKSAPIGTISVVGEDTNQKNSGFLLLMNLSNVLPPAVATLK